MNDFNKATLRRLAKHGVTVMGPVALPDMSSDMPYANAERGYSVNDNGTGKVWTFAQVLAKAAA